MSRRPIIAAFGVLGIVLLMPSAARAQEDADGSKDHPMLSRFPGYYIEEYDPQDFGTYVFQLGDDKEQKVEGRYWKISYWLKDGAKKGGPVELGRNYANLFTQRGGKKLYDTLDSGGGVLTARMPSGGKNIWLEVDVSNSGEVYELTLVEEAAMAQQVEFTPMELARILNEQGSVALHGILFDTGRATIRDESKGELQSVGDLLKQQPVLRLEIQGHTDNIGAVEANRRLSEARAAAVKQYLVSNFGVAADRLLTAGFGDTKPVGDNKTDEGRAANRRVELVKR
jgi:outer membrane protein OmpA-like peptidoglycan-associated protein